MGFFSSVGSFVSSVASTVSSAVSSAWKTTKSVASKAVGWLAEKGEAIVEKIKNVYKSVKKYIPVVRETLKKAAAFVPWPWLKGAMLAVETGLHFLENFSDSDFAKKVEKAIKKVIQYAKKLNSTFFSKEEMKEAKERQKILTEAEEKQKDNGVKKSFTLARLINTYVMLRSSIDELLTEKASLLDFEHYLRLRATQKILVIAEDSLTNANNIDSISEDDLFMIEVGNNLMQEIPTLSDEDTVRLDNIIQKRFNKKLLPFVFEEMIIAWGLNLKEHEENWRSCSNKLSKDKVKMKRLQNEQELLDLSAEDKKELADLFARVPSEIERVDLLAKRKREKEKYIYAAEGLLQTIEKSVEELESEGKEYLIDDSELVGRLVIDCMQHGKRWESLTEDEQSLIIDYANIFSESCKQRTADFIKVAV